MNINYPKEKYLWKFLDLYKFISFLKTGEIFFSRLDTFNDELELISEQMAKEIAMDFNIAEIPPFNRIAKIPDNEYEKREESLINRLGTLKYIQKKFAASCFFSSNQESVAMWKLYAGKAGIALKFDAKKLTDKIEESFKATHNSDMTLMGKQIVYKDLSGVNGYYDEHGQIKKSDSSFYVFNKDESYSHEKEYRFVINKNDNSDMNSLGLKIDLTNDYFRFVISPDTEDWKIELLNSMIKEAGINCPISKSVIITQKLIRKYKLNLFDRMTGNQRMPGRSAIMYI